MKLSLVGRGALVSGDWHGGPDESLPASVYDAADYAQARCYAFVANGDVFDLLIHGVEAYRRGPYLALVRDLFATLEEVYFIVGNHEGRLAWVKPLLADMPHVHVVTSLDVQVGGVLWHIEHGSRYSVDWSFMRPVYQAVAEAMLIVAPRLWLRICRRWLPSTIRATGERTKYDSAVGTCWANAIKDGVRRRSNVVLNHTHLVADILLGTGLRVMDTGDIRDGSVVIIDSTGADVNWFLDGD